QLRLARIALHPFVRRERVLPEILLPGGAALGAEVILDDGYDRRQITDGELIRPVASEYHAIFSEHLEEVVERGLVKGLIGGRFAVHEPQHLRQLDEHLRALREFA